MTDSPMPKSYSPFKRRQRRMLFLGLILPAFGLATILALLAISRTGVYFYPPTKLVEADPSEVIGRQIRLGGMVVRDTLRPGAESQVQFKVTDGKSTVHVIYDDALPGLVTEGEGVVAQGTVRADGVFVASNVLAKHDENYMAPEVAEALKESGMYEKYKQTGSIE